MDRPTNRPWPLGSPRRHPGPYSFPPSPKKFLHSFLRCLKNSRSRFKSFFFRKKLRSFDGFDQMLALWSMFWFKPFRNFLRKIAIFWTFDHWSEILSLSAGRPISQDACPALPVVPVLLLWFLAPSFGNLRWFLTSSFGSVHLSCCLALSFGS
jgi:hypothetical protein